MTRLGAIADSLSIPSAARHVFVCVDATTPKCAPVGETRDLWRYLKQRLKELGLTSGPPAWQGTGDFEPVVQGRGCVLRSKVDCLRICESGPIVVVYPEGIWYHSVTIPIMERIITEHVVGGREVSDNVFARSNP